MCLLWLLLCDEVLVLNPLKLSPWMCFLPWFVSDDVVIFYPFSVPCISTLSGIPIFDERFSGAFNMTYVCVETPAFLMNSGLFLVLLTQNASIEDRIRITILPPGNRPSNELDNSEWVISSVVESPAS